MSLPKLYNYAKSESLPPIPTMRADFKIVFWASMISSPSQTENLGGGKGGQDKNWTQPTVFEDKIKVTKQFSRMPCHMSECSQHSREPDSSCCRKHTTVSGSFH